MGPHLEKGINQASVLTPNQWFQRFMIQAGWTRDVRQYAIAKMRLGRSARVLEVGCGPGALIDSFRHEMKANFYGLDLRLDFVQLAQKMLPAFPFTCGDANHLPYAARSYDAVFSHYFLLWLRTPEVTLKEMVRVTRNGGWVVALAEPDYNGRIDHPQALAELGQQQAQALQNQGANIQSGRQLGELFRENGLKDVEVGLMGGHWKKPPDENTWQSEWEMLRQDLAGIVTQQTLNQLQNIDQMAWQEGRRVLFVPTFFAFGRV